jgi:hypothetical protein
LVDILHNLEWVHSSSSIGHMVKVMIQQHIVECEFDKNRVQLMELHNSQSMKLGWVGTEHIAWWVHSMCSTEQLGMVLHRRGKIELKLHTSKGRFEELHNNQSISLGLVNNQQIVKFEYHSKHMKGMVMAQRFERIIERFHHRNRGLEQGFHSILPRQLELVGIQ